jgi:hypothetical protein
MAFVAEGLWFAWLFGPLVLVPLAVFLIYFFRSYRKNVPANLGPANADLANALESRSAEHAAKAKAETTAGQQAPAG